MSKICSVSDCDKVVFARDYCNKHYRTDRLARAASCLHCDKPAFSKGMCGRHYNQWWRYGRITDEPKLSLDPNFWDIVRREQMDRLGVI